jgi:diguanylate cyclase (GGDEF)-like protein
MLPMAICEEGIITAKRIQMELRKESFFLLDRNIYMTVSIGLAQYKPKEEMKTFIHRLDKLMYQAKKDGRNRICPDRRIYRHRVIGS